MGGSRRMGSGAMGILLSTTLLSSSTMMLAEEPKPESPFHPSSAFSFLALDGFEERLALNWQPIRPNPSHVSLKTNTGKLTIRTEGGSISGPTTTPEERRVKNIYVINNPLAKETDWVATTCITAFRPEGNSQQAGLILYDDDENHLKWIYMYNYRSGQGQVFSFYRETAGQRIFEHVGPFSGHSKVWLRLAKRGNSYEYAASTNGQSFTVYGEKPWRDGAPKMIGLLASDLPETDVCFDFFELRSPIPNE